MNALIHNILSYIKIKEKRRKLYVIWLASLICTGVDFLITGLFLYFLGRRTYFPTLLSVFKLGTSLNNLPVSIAILSTSMGEFTFIICNYISCINYTVQYGNVAKNKKGFIKFFSLYFLSFIFSQISNLFLFALIKQFWFIKIIKIIPTSIIGSYVKNKYIFNIKLLGKDDSNEILL